MTRPTEKMVTPVSSKRLVWLLRLALFVLMLYVFLAAITLLQNAISIFGAGAVQNLFVNLQDPFAGLAVGILATVLVQSSSVTTSIVVCLVGQGTLSLEVAVPIIMGANVGTSITNTFVALGHVNQDSAFRRAFAGATVHDVFNLMTVLILFPLELATGFLQRGAEWLGLVVGHMFGGWNAEAAGQFNSPIKAAVEWLAGGIESIFKDGLGMQGTLLGIVLLILALALIFLSLIVITKNMRLLMADWIEAWLNRVLTRRGFLGMAVGAGITATVQSSSITTSLLIPMFGAGVLKLEAGFPIMLGANIGTTITALLAALVAGPMGLVIALVHLLFNVAGTLLFFPIRFMRRIPLRAAEKLADLAVYNRVWVVVYILGVFVIAPIIGILIWR